MKFLWFHLMPYKELPADFKDKHPSAVMMWFQGGKLWRSRGEAQDAAVAARREEARKKRPPEHPPRDRKWRPGGTHRDPRQKYKDARKAKWTRFKERLRQGAHPRPPGKTSRPPGKTSRPPGKTNLPPARRRRREDEE